MIEYTGDHRICDNPDCIGNKMKMSQDISWQSNCVTCGKDLSDAPKGFGG